MQIYNVIMLLKAEREVNMRKTTKRRLSSLLCAVLMLVTSIDVTAFAAESKASKRKIDVWDIGTVQEADTDKYNNHITAADWENCDNVSRMVNSLPEKQHLVILQSIIMPMTDYSRHQAKTMEAMR